MTSLEQIAGRIIQEQELVIGPLAWAEAGKVQGLRVDRTRHEAILTNGDPKEAVNRLVAQYERLFGRASHEVCREAVRGMLASLTPSEIPSSLRV
ncbi:MAG: hypothetical protein Q7R65_02345 [bacterium]|nr:hypothetical protein [bacterium]